MARDQATGTALMFSGHRRPGSCRIAGVGSQLDRDTVRCQASRG